MNSLLHDADDRLRARLKRARLYLICDGRPGDREPERFLHLAIAGGVDVVQLRDKRRDDSELIAVASVFRRVCDERGALFIVNDRPDLAAACGADGVHVGQDDMPIAEARAVVGAARIVGLSTHSPEDIDGAAGADYIGVGPVHSTPTKPGRPAVGLDLVGYAAANARPPFFAIGGIDASNAGEVLAAGARRLAVVRAITEAPDPEATARVLRSRIEAADYQQESSRGAA